METERTVQKDGAPEGWKETDCRLIRFTEPKLRWLYSLEWNRVQYDLLDTEPDQAMLKADWLDEWKEKLFTTLEHPQPDYLIDDEDLLYAEIGREAEKEDRPVWLYAFVLELIRFAPYYSLDESDRYKTLEVESDYVSEVFCRKQSAVTPEDARRLKKLYSRYEKRIKGKMKKKLEKRLLRSGFRIVFVSVPYSFLLSRLLSTGICVIIDKLRNAAPQFVLSECSKLAALCDDVILGENPGPEDGAEAAAIRREVRRQAKELEDRIRESGKEEEKDRIKVMKTAKRYLNNCAAQLQILLNKNGFSDEASETPVQPAEPPEPAEK